MENQTLCVDTPQYDITTNTYVHNTNNNNIINNSSSKGSYQMVSPVTLSCSASKGGVHRRCSSDGYFDITLAEDDFYKGLGMDMDEAQDDLALLFLDLREYVSFEEQCDIGKGGGGGSDGGDEVDKRKRGRPRISGGLTESVVEFKKTSINSDKLEDLRNLDLKRAKRILANRQSAARSKERKARYLVELEHRIRALQVDTTNLTTRLRIYQRDTMGLTEENVELKIRLQVMERQDQLRNAQNEALKQEVERLKTAMGELKTPMASPSTMQTGSYSPDISSPRNCNMFSFQNQLPPLHTSRPTIPNRCFHPIVPEQNHSLG